MKLKCITFFLGFITFFTHSIYAQSPKATILHQNICPLYLSKIAQRQMIAQQKKDLDEALRKMPIKPDYPVEMKTQIQAAHSELKKGFNQSMESLKAQGEELDSQIKSTMIEAKKYKVAITQEEIPRHCEQLQKFDNCQEPLRYWQAEVDRLKREVLFKDLNKFTAKYNQTLALFSQPSLSANDMMSECGSLLKNFCEGGLTVNAIFNFFDFETACKKRLYDTIPRKAL